MKNGDLSIVFSVQGTDGSPTGPDPENRVSDQDTGSPGRPVSSGLQVSGEPEQEKETLTARVLMLLKLRASPDMLSFSLCNKKRQFSI